MYVCGTFLFLMAIISISCIEGSMKEFASRNHEFSAKFYKQLCQNQTGNFVVSPLSTELMLELIAEGAGGSTYDELRGVLRLPSSKRDSEAHIGALLSSLNQDSDNLKLFLANKIYLSKQFSVKETYQEIATTIYKCDVEKVNFGIKVTADDINKWVEDQTNDQIKDLVNKNDIEGAVMLLVNTLYFSGKWNVGFPKYSTDDQMFSYKVDKYEKIKMLRSDAFAKYGYHYSDTLKAKFLEIPFKSSDFSMVCVLPDESNGLTEQVEAKIEDYIKVTNFSQEYVDVRIPKFSFSSEFEFLPSLKEMGVEMLFDPSQAELGDIADGPLHVNSVKQKVVINISEDGANAAASTKQLLRNSGMLDLLFPYTFMADHPFLFYIKQRSTDVILFVGRFVGTL